VGGPFTSKHGRDLCQTSHTVVHGMLPETLSPIPASAPAQGPERGLIAADHTARVLCSRPPYVRQAWPMRRDILFRALWCIGDTTWNSG